MTRRLLFCCDNVMQKMMRTYSALVERKLVNSTTKIEVADVQGEIPTHT